MLLELLCCKIAAFMPTASDNRNPWSTRKEGGCCAFQPDSDIPEKRVGKYIKHEELLIG
jgi:hypothetical protein